jgi:hypothetical protein
MLTKEGGRELITRCVFQIALRELDENQKSAVEELKDSIEKEGLDAAFKQYFNKHDRICVSPMFKIEYIFHNMFFIRIRL